MEQSEKTLLEFAGYCYIHKPELANDLNTLIADFINKPKEQLAIPRVSFPLFDNLYSQFVQMDDRFESVHIWSEVLALKNKGRWTPIAISKEKYLEEMRHSWNNGS